MAELGQENSKNAGAEKFLGFAPERPDLVAAALLAVSILVFFAPVIFSGQVFYFRDLCLEIVPKRWFLSNSGAPPLWNPYSFFGMPAAANSQWFVFYPLNFIFHLGSTPRALGVYIILHFAVAMVGTYVLARSLKHSAPAAAAAALAFGFGGFFASCGVQVLCMNSAAWIMPVLWAAGMALRTGNHRFTAGAGIFWSLQVLGGEPEIACLTGFILLIFMGGLAWGRSMEISAGRAAGRALLVIIIAGIVALALSSVQWVLTLEMAAHSNRSGGVPFEDAVKWSLEPGALKTFLVPNLIMDPASSDFYVLGFQTSKLPYLLSVYPGVTVLLAAVAGLAGNRRQWVVFAVGAVMFLVLSLGKYGGFYRVFYLIMPGFDAFRIPERCMYGFAVFVSLMAAGGVDALKKDSGRDAGSREGHPALAVIPAAVALAGFAIAAMLARRLGVPAGPQEYYSFHQGLIGLSAMRSALMLFAGLCAVFMFRYRPALGKTLAWSACAVIFLDLYQAHRHVNPPVAQEFYSLEGSLAELIPPEGRERRVAVMPPASALDQTLGAGRNIVDFYRKQRLWLRPFVGLEAGIKDALSHSSFYPADVDLWKKTLTGSPPPVQEKLMALSGIKYVLTPGEGLREVPGALPRTYMVPKVRWLADRESVIEEMKEPGFDPQKEVLLEGETMPGPAVGPDSLFWPAEIMRDDYRVLEIIAPPDNPGYLVVLDSFQPGWRASINGRDVPLLRANGFFRAVAINRDGGRVKLSYLPRRYPAALAVSLISLAACLAFVFRGAGSLLWWPLWVLLLAGLPMIEGGTTYAPVTAMRILVLVMAGAWALSLVRKRRAVLMRTRLDMWVLGFWVLAGVHLIASEYEYITLYWLLNIMTLAILFFFTVQFVSDPDRGTGRVKAVLGIIIAASLIQALWALVEGGAPGHRASAGYFNPNYLAGSLMMVAPLLLARAVSADGPGTGAGFFKRAGSLALFAVFLMGVVASSSRAAIILPLPLIMAAGPGLERLLVERGMAPKKARVVWLAGFASLLLLTVLALAVFPNPLRTRLRDLDKDRYSMERANIWKSSLEMIADHPLGVGPGMYKYYSFRYNFPVENVPGGRYERHAHTAHNEYLTLAAEMSPLAVFLLLWPALLLIRASWWPRQKEGYGLAAGLGAGILAAALHSLFDSNLHNGAIAVLVVVMAALLTVELSREREGWASEGAVGKSGRTMLAALFLVLLAAGIPGNLYLGWSYRLYLKAESETEPVRKALRLREAARDSMGNTAAYKGLANALYREYSRTGNLKNLEEAVRAGEQAAALNPADPSPLRLRAQYFLDFYIATGEGKFLDLSQESFSLALERNPYDVDALLGMAMIFRIRRDGPGEISWLVQCIEIEPYELKARLRLAAALARSGRVEEARAEWRNFQKRWKTARDLESSSPGAFFSAYRRKRVTVDQEEIQRVKMLMESLEDSGKTGKKPGPEIK